MQKLIPIGEAAEFLKVSIDTVRRWDKLGILHSTRPGGKIRCFDLEELKKVKFGIKVSTPKTNRLKKVGPLVVKILLLLLTILTILFLLFPQQTARLLTSFM